MYNKSEINQEHIWRTLLRLADRLSSSGVTDCDLPSRLPLSQLRVVGVIYDRHPTGVMLKDIAEELNLTPGAVSQTVDVLVKENIVERTVSPHDRRAILLRPTAIGLELKEQHSRKISGIMEHISQDISKEDFIIFADVLGKLLEQLLELSSGLFSYLKISMYISLEKTMKILKEI